MRYLDPKNDLAFKKIFGEHPHLLRSFLNALLPLGHGREIVSLEYLPAELVPEVPLMKYTVVDVRCMDNHGRQFIVEMQLFWTDSFKHRVLFKASKAYVRQLDKGRDYKGLQSVFALSLVNENFEKDTDEYYHHYSIMHNQLTGKRLEGLEFVFIELPKFKARNITEKKLQVLWLRFLTEMGEKTDIPPADLLENKEVSQAIEQLREGAFSRGELEAYDRYWDSVSTERTFVMEKEEQALERGMEMGMERGMEMGMEQGMEQGIKLTLWVVRLHNQGLDANTIASETGQPLDLILQLLKEAGLRA
jgi:predicted transposase/invertase (TIGR01784 family)